MRTQDAVENVSRLTDFRDLDFDRTFSHLGIKFFIRPQEGVDLRDGES